VLRALLIPARALRAALSVMLRALSAMSLPVVLVRAMVSFLSIYSQYGTLNGPDIKHPTSHRHKIATRKRRYHAKKP
jgi:hypothetical protein